MAYIRNKKEELTGYQEHEAYRQSIDFGNDFVMVYGIDDTMPRRIREFKERGYVVHLMTGIAWGEYQDYLGGKWDGREHWDEGQKERDGKDVAHGPTVPYMCPTVSFADYITDRLKIAVDSGVEAIHVEEPEYWDRSGYSEAFRREYEIYYHESWRPQHESADARYRSARLKVYLYCRTISRVSSAVKEYAKVRYGKDLRFYVPTHSLINYTTWKILSPEAELLNIPTVDGYIAQIWTGTSREGNVYEGVYRERTFETAFLEYGVMQELVRGTDRRMWFLNDPIEDRPMYTWDNYRLNYRKTAVASLLQPNVWHYEICPWPARVFDGKYPRIPKEKSTIPVDRGADAAIHAVRSQGLTPQPIPKQYSTMLSSMFQLFGDMEQADWEFEGACDGVGVFLSDSALYQRSFPDGVIRGEGLGQRLDDVLCKNTHPEGYHREESRALMKEITKDPNLMLDFIQSMAFPQFYGLALPLLKYGLAVRPVQLDNVQRYPGYLRTLRCLVLSYEFLKPMSPDVNAALVSWMRDGGEMIYVGDGSDPFHGVRAWWTEAGYANPAQHLFRLCDLPEDPENGRYAVGNGALTVLKITPASICLTKEAADSWRELVRKTLRQVGLTWEYRNDLTLHRGPYVICGVMDESVSDAPKVFEGLYADLLENDYAIITRKEVAKDDNAILFDFGKIEKESFRVIGTAARIDDVQLEENRFRMTMKAADRIHVFARLRMPGKVVEAAAVDEDGRAVALGYRWDDHTHTVLLDYESESRCVTVTGRMAAYQEG